VDAGHLAEIREDPTRFAPGGIAHLVLEVIAYAADEADGTTTGRCVVTLHNDGSVSVADNGLRVDMNARANGRDGELFALVAGSATRPGIPTALWLGVPAHDVPRPRANRRKLRRLLARWLA